MQPIRGLHKSLCLKVEEILQEKGALWHQAQSILLESKVIKQKEATDPPGCFWTILPTQAILEKCEVFASTIYSPRIESVTMWIPHKFGSTGYI